VVVLGRLRRRAGWRAASNSARSRQSWGVLLVGNVLRAVVGCAACADHVACVTLSLAEHFHVPLFCELPVSRRVDPVLYGRCRLQCSRRKTGAPASSGPEAFGFGTSAADMQQHDSVGVGSSHGLASARFGVKEREHTAIEHLNERPGPRLEPANPAGRRVLRPLRS
jgi:hypothetical protein